MQKPITFLMFSGKAEEAMNFYVSVFKQSEIKNLVRYSANEAGPEGTIKTALFAINGQEYMCIDSYVKHAFTFTPAISLFINCDSTAEIDSLFAQLSKDGKVFMPLAPYPFAKKFGWLEDRFGVSWQLKFNV